MSGRALGGVEGGGSGRAVAAPGLLRLLGRGGAVLIFWTLLGLTILLLPGEIGPVVVLMLSTLFVVTSGRRLLAGPPPTSPGRVRPEAVAGLLGVTAMFAFAAGGTYQQLFPSPDLDDPFFQYASSGWLAALALHALPVVYAPLVEEFVFRGWVQRNLSARWGSTAGVAVTAALFALLHWPASWLPFFFLVGLVMGASYEVSGRLFVPVLQHMVFNAVTIAAGGGSTFGPLLPPLPGGVWSGVAVVILTAPLLLLPGWVRRPGSQDASVPAVAG